MADYGTAISLSRELSHTSEDSSSDQSPRSVPSKHQKLSITTDPDNNHHYNHHHHLPTALETQRKPRGRPPGSKNKPKPPVIITKDSDSAMKPAILEISAGSDIVDSIVNFARKNHSGICVISATGSVSNVTLRHPHSHAPSLSLHGPFNLLSLSGSFLGFVAPKQSSWSSSSSCFGISLAGAQGQIFGGIIAGKVLAATQVVVVATTFSNPKFHRLPSDDNNDDDEVEDIKPNPAGGSSVAGNDQSMTVYNAANATPINSQISPPEIMHWPGPSPNSRPHY
ncbi:AT-hook motif nuclear-localized protein 28-like [Mercurialis annua]|uniref:AT-hook motif nuclear-localized protein 28-like n=1 Tax=Mercurialis annua TaxID=3986 RepID=UPI00215E99B1|nr:AT-hook motif nuclear-localized protein 28-like [Mercurialis annua]